MHKIKANKIKARNVEIEVGQAKQIVVYAKLVSSLNEYLRNVHKT